MMIECEICHEWYHGKCLKIARGKVKGDDVYTCPICDHRVKIPRDAARPKLEELQAWHSELELLPFQPEEEETLLKVVSDGAAYRDFIRPFINPENTSTPEEVRTLRFHLRKLEGADILLAEETNYLRQELHKWVPIAPEPPPVVEISGSTRKPRPTKLQKTMAQHGVTTPDDLPASHKQRGLYTKRKGSDITGKKPLQPAGSSASPGAQGSPTSTSAIDDQPLSAGPKPKLFLTALAIQVLGDLIKAPVVSPMLVQEPHMNTEKLTKMKWLLEHDSECWENLHELKLKLTTLQLPTRSGQPISYENLRPATTSAVASERESPLFGAATPTRLGSPHSPDERDAHAQYSPHPYPSRTSPNSHAFDSNMFETPSGAESIFESPARDGKADEGSPDYERSAMRSPEFGGSQHSADNIDPVFTELMNDHEALGNDNTDAMGRNDLLDHALVGDESDEAKEDDIDMPDVPSDQH